MIKYQSEGVMALKVSLLYGKRKLSVDLPDERVGGILEKREMPYLDDPWSVLMKSLKNPIASPPLEEISKGRKNACIVISDNTRPVPNELLLKGILEILKKNVPKIKILIANGLHKELNEDQIKELVGKDIFENFEILNHNALKKEELVYIGDTPRGIPIYINKNYIESDLRILTGLVEPHFMAGYSGGRKSICPGISGYETVKFFHSPMLLESPKADNCVVEGNPLHEEATYIAKKVGVDFIVNVAIDSEKRVSGIFAGDLEKAWFEAVKYVSRYSEVPLSEKYDIVITTNGGYPLDRNYYQTVKGLVAGVRALKKGGILIIAAECIDGLGSEYFKKSLQILKEIGDYDRYIDYISKPENFLVDQWEVEELVKVLKVASKIYMFSEGLNREDWEYTFTEKIEDVEKGVEKALEIFDERAKILVIPEGPYIIPRIEGGE